MSKSSTLATNKSHKKIYDRIVFLLRKDSEYNKDYLEKHADEYGYDSVSEFIKIAIHNQIDHDLDN